MTDNDKSFQMLSTSPLSRRSSRRPRGRSHRIIIGAVWGLLAFIVAVGISAAVLAHQIVAVRSQLEQVVDLVPQVRDQLGEGEYAAAKENFDSMQSLTTAARLTTTGPLWKAASAVPFLGPNFGAVTEVAVSADDVATRAVAPLLDTYDSLDWRTLSPVDGRIDVAQLQEASPSISTAASTVRLSYERLASIDLSKVLPQVADPVRAATEQLDSAVNALGPASSAAELLPTMLGAEGPRTYLVLVQNSAEVRATGGIPGALATLNTNDGRISLGTQSSAGALGKFVPPFDVDSEQQSLFTSRLGTQMQNVNLTPDFPTAAATAQWMWEERHPGSSLDGVIGLDPVVLSHLLDATGAVDLTDPDVLRLIEDTSLPTALTKDNVVPTLLSDVYREIEDPAAQDAYFAAVAGMVFAAFTDGQGDATQLIKALVSSADEDRLYLWSIHKSEQDIIASTPLHGSVVGSNAGGAAFGAYFNDGTGAKMDYYAKRTVQLVQTCQPGDYSQYTVRLNVTNSAPVDAASALPAYVTGGGVFGVDPGRIRTNHVVYGPAQSFVETASVNGEPVPLGTGKHGNRPVGTVTVELGPGESAVLDVTFSRVVQDSEPRLMVTPTIESLEKVVLPFARDTTCQ